GAAALADPRRAHRPGSERMLVEEGGDAVEDEQRRALEAVRRGGRLDDVHECDPMPLMRRRLYLMRHAEVSYVGERDPTVVRLTERGLEQAAAARRALDDVRFDLVLTSALPRTAETATVVAPDVEPERWPEFDEWRGGPLD